MGNQSSVPSSARTAAAQSAAHLADKVHRSRAGHLRQVLKADSQDAGVPDEDIVSPESQCCSASQEMTEEARQVEPMDYIFPFENLVFEGGGNKGVAYFGVLRCLEHCGVLGQIKRFGGSSAGSVTATLLACGVTVKEAENSPFLTSPDKLMLDAKYGIFSMIPNMLGSYGWHPAKNFYQEMGKVLKEKTGNADVTFQQLYRQTGRELCIVVTSLTHRCAEYCHPKTTPDMPVRLAVRMSVSIPVLFSAPKVSESPLGYHEVFTDGGVTCNYPVHCFDGWYLSMEPEDSFLKRLRPLRAIPRLMRRSERFGTTNEKTLGVVVFTEDEVDEVRIGLESRYVCRDPPAPSRKTKLLKEWQENRQQKTKVEREHEKTVNAVSAFLKMVEKHNKGNKNVVNLRELRKSFQNKAEFTDEHAEVLFGKDITVREVFELLDSDGNGKIQYGELVQFIERSGVEVQMHFRGKKPHTIDGLSTYLDSLQNTVLNTTSALSLKECDLERSIGVNTGHVGTTDFTLEDPDRQFLFERGVKSTRAFLQYYITKHPDNVQKKEAHMPTQHSQMDH